MNDSTKIVKKRKWWKITLVALGAIVIVLAAAILIAWNIHGRPRLGFAQTQVAPTGFSA